MSYQVGGRIWSAFWKYWYPYVTQLMKDESFVFMNYGFQHPDLTPTTLPLQENDEPDRLFIHLYHQAASFAALENKDVLEVSSGHGGGASYVSRYLKPKSYTGLERNPKAVKFSSERHQIPNLKFIEGDAMKIDLPNDSCDVVLNVEASHSYADAEIFYAEAARVLRPGGCLLTTDFRSQAKLKNWNSQLTSSGLEIKKEADITSNVLEAMSLVNEKRHKMINSWVPGLLHSFFRHFAGVQGSSIYNSFVERKRVYMSFALQKPA